jgi:tRNA pseudouridine55 synthase
MDRYNGILPVLKKAGMTSHDVIYRLRRIFGQKKIGHTGTLDPQASGLLLICLGRATKLTQFLSDWDKLYKAEITLGYTSDTLDSAGEVIVGAEIPELTDKEMEEIVSRFRGCITQRVPAYSAVKVDGKELYKYARKGVKVDSPQREVEIKSLDILSFKSPTLIIQIHCSKGTYIRTLADDIGREIGCGAILTRLERLSIGPHKTEDAMTLEELESVQLSGDLMTCIVPIEKALDFPIVNLREAAAEMVKHGRVPMPSDIISWRGEFNTGDIIGMADERGQILAIGKSKCDASLLAGKSNVDFFSYLRVLI